MVTKRTILREFSLVLGLVVVFAITGSAQAEGLETFSSPSGMFSPMKHSRAEKQSLKWARSHVADKDVVQKIKQLWEQSRSSERHSGDEVHSLIIETFQIGSPRVAAFFEYCSVDCCGLDGQPLVPMILSRKSSLLQNQPKFFVNNVLLYNAQQLTHCLYYDEALQVFKTLKPETVADPASYFFNRAVCENGLLMKPEGLVSAKMLLENVDHVPTRYKQLAMLISHNLNELEENSLDHISRKMKNIERNLEHGRVGHKVIKDQEEILEALDVIIEKMSSKSEEDRDENSVRRVPSRDTNEKGTQVPEFGLPKANGSTGEKKVSQKSKSWGNLSSKERVRVKEILERDYPSHYQKLIQEYSKVAALEKK